jgi:serine/threonine protein kinase
MKPVERIGEEIFELEREIGRGGSGAVWRALELEPPRRTVAVKLVSYSEKDYEKRADEIEKLFAREAETWAEFQKSPYVVQLYRTFKQRVTSSEGSRRVFGFIMELSQEGDLRQAIASNRLDLDKSATITLLLEIARGLREGHVKDILHRDIKATNVLLFKGVTDKCSPKLMDFGLSITTEQLDARLVGTPEYMAPEVFDSPQVASKASDIYSLGVLFYEVILKKLPFLFNPKSKDERMELYRKAHKNDLIKLDEIKAKSGKEFERLLGLMLEKEAKNRATIAQVIACLEKLEATTAFETLRSTPGDAQLRKNRYLWHPLVHESIGEKLAYFLLRGSSPKGDSAWLVNNLNERGFRGFSIHPILGGYDHILRIWYNQDSHDELERVLRDFRDFHSGRPYLQCHINSVNRLRGKPIPLLSSRETILKGIIAGFAEDEVVEGKRLQRSGLVLSTLKADEPKRFGLRFFLVINAGTRADRFLINAYANEFAKALEHCPGLSSLSVYEGDGDFQILIKFRLRKFEQFTKVFDAFLSTKAIVQRNESLINSSTFIEFARDPSEGADTAIESDDGSILTEAAQMMP